MRIGDVNISLNRRLDDMKEVLRTEMDLRFERIDIRFERLDSKLDTIINMLGQLDTRVTKLEGRSS